MLNRIIFSHPLGRKVIYIATNVLLEEIILLVLIIYWKIIELDDVMTKF